MATEGASPMSPTTHGKRVQMFHDSIRYGSTTKSLRWEDEEGNIIWSPERVFVMKIMQAQQTEICMSLVIALNFGFICIEANEAATCHPVPEGMTLDECLTGPAISTWLWYPNIGMLVIYTVEASLRLFAERYEFFRNSWNILDLVIVGSGWVTEIFRAIPSLTFLRFLRTLRLLRMLRIFISFRELYLLITGMMSAIRTLVFSTIMLFSLLTLWSIILVEYVHPVNADLVYEGCTRCPKAFASVMDSNLTLFQTIVAGDSWGLVAVPIIEEQPLLAFIMISIVITVSLGLMNLILAVIVERAQEAREQDKEAKMREKENEQAQQKMELFGYCQDMDTDNSGEIDLKELLAAYDATPPFRTLLSLMDIHKDELQSVFRLLDKDGSGSVSYIEFCEELHKIRTRDTRTMLTFLKLQVNESSDKTDTLKKITEMGMQEQAQKMDEHSALLETVIQRLDKLGSLPTPTPASPTRAGGAWAAGSPGRSAWSARGLPPGTAMAAMVDISQGQSLVEALCQEARNMASVKNDMLARLEAQIETLLQHSDWLASMASVEAAEGEAKAQRVKERMCRMRENLGETGLGLEATAGALARNSEILSLLSRDIDFQPKDGQRRPDRGLSPRIGAQRKESKVCEDLSDSPSALEAADLSKFAAICSACTSDGIGKGQRIILNSGR